MIRIKKEVKKVEGKQLAAVKKPRNKGKPEEYLDWARRFALEVAEQDQEGGNNCKEGKDEKGG